MKRFLIFSLALFLSLGVLHLRADEKKSGDVVKTDAGKKLNVLVAVTNETRGKHYKDFLEQNGIECMPMIYGDIKEEGIKGFDLFIADTPAGSFKDVSKEMASAKPQNLPKMDIPIIGVASVGWQLLRNYHIALGEIKT